MNKTVFESVLRIFTKEQFRVSVGSDEPSDAGAINESLRRCEITVIPVRHEDGLMQSKREEVKAKANTEAFPFGFWSERPTLEYDAESDTEYIRAALYYR